MGILENVFSNNAIDQFAIAVEDSIKDIPERAGLDNLVLAADIISAIKTALADADYSGSEDPLKDKLKEIILEKLDDDTLARLLDPLLDELYEFGKGRAFGDRVEVSLDWKNTVKKNAGQHETKCIFTVCSDNAGGWTLNGCCNYTCQGVRKQCCCGASRRICVEQNGSGTAGSCKANRPKIKTTNIKPANVR